MTRLAPAWGMPVIGAVAWCAVFATVHLYWAVGGGVGLASSAGPDLAQRRPAVFVLLGLYGVALLLLVGATLLIVASQGFGPSRLSRTLRGTVVVVGTALLVRGVAVEVLLAMNIGGLRDSVGSPESRWSLIAWNPWFAIGGGLFLWTDERIRHQGRRSKPGRDQNSQGSM